MTWRCILSRHEKKNGFIQLFNVPTGLLAVQKLSIKKQKFMQCYYCKANVTTVCFVVTLIKFGDTPDGTFYQFFFRDKKKCVR